MCLKHSCTVSSPRLKCFSFIKVVAFKITISGLILLCDLSVLSSHMKIESEGGEINKYTPCFEMCFENPSMPEEDISTVVTDGSFSDF